MVSRVRINPQLVFFLTVFFVFSAVLTSLAAIGPKIQFATPLFDFGQLQSGEVAKYTFMFTNVGDQLLEIKDVRPSCGCTTAGAWDRGVEPGKTGSIPVQFNSGSSSGVIGKTVIVLCNDPGQTNIVLQIKGTIWKPVELTPAIAFFSTSSDSQTNEARLIQIVNNIQEPLELSQPQCTNHAFQATLKTVRPGKEFQLEVTFLQPRETGIFTAPITLTTTSTNLPVISVTAYAMVQPAVVVTPSQLSLPAGPLASSAVLSVNIRNNGIKPLILSNPVTDPAGGDVRVQEVKPGSQFILSVSFPAGFRNKPGQNLQIRVATNHPQFPLLKIPIVEGLSLAAELSESETARREHASQGGDYGDTAQKH